MGICITHFRCISTARPGSDLRVVQKWDPWLKRTSCRYAFCWWGISDLLFGCFCSLEGTQKVAMVNISCFVCSPLGSTPHCARLPVSGNKTCLHEKCTLEKEETGKGHPKSTASFTVAISEVIGGHWRGRIRTQILQCRTLWDLSSFLSKYKIEVITDPMCH